MAFVVFLYIILLLIFFVISGLVVRHTLKFGNLSPAFKIVVFAFAVLAIVIIVYSLYLLFSLGSVSGGTSLPSVPSLPSSSGGDLNF